MKKPVEWWHLIFQTALFVFALSGMLWNFSTSSQKQRDDIDMLKTRMDNIEHVRHEDALLQESDMKELKGKIDDLNQKIDDLRVIIQDKQDRKH
jgi:polyhydroxyalkanoate synthesis regulator phasin